ncbi:hypothetical protein DM02DRAFT_665639 [Periconia macrospinosa]|uniref:Transposase n=1 Tax=Periconia macrospinosa TaxID=97972 RepID=A0A2V1CWD9_9PLEO|nr:hypothetical protein DM02DRAFT_665639 [Periconia macrospinosa]
MARATLDAAYGRMPYKQIAQLEGVMAGRKALAKQVRMVWATEHADWKPEQWA